MDTTTKGLVVIMLLISLTGMYVWFDRERTLQCRHSAAERGTPTLEAIKFCKQ